MSKFCFMVPYEDDTLYEGDMPGRFEWSGVFVAQQAARDWFEEYGKVETDFPITIDLYYSQDSVEPFATFEVEMELEPVFMAKEIKE